MLIRHYGLLLYCSGYSIISFVYFNLTKCKLMCCTFPTSRNSDDNLLKNIELFDKLSVRFSSRIKFMKDIVGRGEICCWAFYGQGRKVAEVCCESIVYATDRKHTKIEFPEAKILEETLNITLYERREDSAVAQSNIEPTSRSRRRTPEGFLSEDESRWWLIIAFVHNFLQIFLSCFIMYHVD